MSRLAIGLGPLFFAVGLALAMRLVVRLVPHGPNFTIDFDYSFAVAWSENQALFVALALLAGMVAAAIWLVAVPPGPLRRHGDVVDGAWTAPATLLARSAAPRRDLRRAGALQFLSAPQRSLGGQVSRYTAMSP